MHFQQILVIVALLAAGANTLPAPTKGSIYRFDYDVLLSLLIDRRK